MVDVVAKSMTPAKTLAAAQAKVKRESLELAMALQFRAVGLSPERQYRWHPTRNFAADFAFVADKLLVEVEGGAYSGGRHVRGAGFTSDCARQAEALMLGWRVLRVTGEHLRSGAALRWAQHLLLAELTP